MEARTKLEFKVGIFISIAIVFILAVILALGGEKTFFHQTISYKFQVDETGGVDVGSVVQIAGVVCGHVKKITFDSGSNKVNIDISVEKRFASRITKGTTAGLRTQGALGDRFVLIKPGPMSGTPINEGDFIDAEASSGDLFSTLGKSGNRIEHVFDILDGVNKLVHDLNDRNFSENLAETTRNLKGTTAELHEILASLKGSDAKNNKVKKSIDHLESILEKIDDGQGTIGGLINDPTVHEDLKSIVGGAKRSKILKYIIRQAIKNNDEAEKEEDKK